MTETDKTCYQPSRWLKRNIWETSSFEIKWESDISVQLNERQIIRLSHTGLVLMVIKHTNRDNPIKITDFNEDISGSILKEANCLERTQHDWITVMVVKEVAVLQVQLC